MRVKLMSKGCSAGRVVRLTVNRLWNVMRSVPRSRSYPLMGVILAFGAPAGLVMARAAAAEQMPTLAWMLEDIRRVSVTYAYVALSTVCLLAVLGYILGRGFDRVRLLSITDPLTGLFNRRYLGQRLAEEMGRGRRYGRSTCVLCVDIDRLKAINDAFGHKAGDHALMAVCRTLLKNIRAADAVARTGGDEFAVLLPETALAEASALSQRILAEVARLSGASPGKLAISIGIAELDATVHLEPEDVLATADAALYRAKAAGGGHATIAQMEPAATNPRPASLIQAAVRIEKHTHAGAGS